MHLTPGELTIIGSAFTLVGVALGAVINHLTSRGKDRRERLDRERTELYEAVLRDSLAMQAARARAWREKPTTAEARFPYGGVTEDDERRGLQARLRMFGSEYVQVAFAVIVELHADWQYDAAGLWALNTAPPATDAEGRTKQVERVERRRDALREVERHLAEATEELADAVRKEIDKGRA